MQALAHSGHSVALVSSQIHSSPMWLFLSPFASLVLASLFAASFVLSLYVWRAALQANRDDPAVIKQRITSTLVLCGMACAAVSILEWQPPAAALSELGVGPSLSTWLGFPSHSYPSALFAPPLLTASLFLGPLVVLLLEVVDEAAQNEQSLLAVVVGRIGSYAAAECRWQSARNLIAAPLAEEILFRGVVLAILVAGGFGFTACVLLSPCLFGMAHLHHLLSHVRARGVSVPQAVLMVSFQLCYTTLFGSYAAAVYLRTGHLTGVILAHAFCNLMGFPELRFMNPRHRLHPKRSAIILAFVAGIVIFSVSFVPLTDDRWLYAQGGEQGEKLGQYTGSWLRHYQSMQQSGVMDKYSPAI